MRRGDSLYVLFGLLIVGVLLGVVFWQASYNSSIRIDRVAPHGVALIDELSLTDTDPGFIDELNETVHKAGYWLDYYPPSDVVIPLFWALPALGYDMVIIRAHSTGWWPGDKITIFTGERYDAGKYQWEQLNHLVFRASNSLQGGPLYFTVSPEYIWKESRGTFPGSLIVMMGCTGLINNQMASAFTTKGAKAYVGWYGPVTVQQTDSATLSLVQTLSQNHTELTKAVSYASNLAGQPMWYRSDNGFEYQGGLGLYPASAGTLTFRDI